MLEHGCTLKEHFDAIVGMIREGTVDSYDMILPSEANRFEDYLKKNRIKYTKTVSYGSGMMPNNSFRLEE